MSWFIVDDKMHSHPKFIGVSLAARGLWATAGSWCGDQLTDGAIPSALLRLWGATPKHAAELVAARLWSKTDAGWQFHDWAEYQRSREHVLNERQKARERMANGRRSSADVRPNIARTADEVPEVLGRSSDSVRLPYPIPSQPSLSEPRERTRTRSALATTPDLCLPTPIAPASPLAAPVAPGSIGTACERVSQELKAVTGRAWPSDAHAQHLRWIAEQPESDWVAVRRTLALDPWAKQYPGRLTPKFLVASWPKYLTPDPGGSVKSDVDEVADARDARRRADIAAQTARIDRERRDDSAPSADEIRALVASVGRGLT